MNSISFFTTALGSYGFPRKPPLPSTSVVMFAILFQMIDASGSKPISWHCTWMTRAMARRGDDHNPWRLTDITHDNAHASAGREQLEAPTPNLL